MAGLHAICSLEQNYVLGWMLSPSFCFGFSSQVAGHFSQQIWVPKVGHGFGQHSLS